MDERELARTDMWELSDRLVRRAGVLPGEHVLELACGSGEAAIRAAQAGARVVILDSTDGLFEGTRRSVARTHVELRDMVGRADALPFGDRTFDVVLSMFGATFARGPDAVAGEVARVLRPGGRLVMFNWCREGVVGLLLDLAAAPSAWGDEEQVRRAFAPTTVEVSTEHELARRPLRGLTMMAEAIDQYMSVLVATITARRIAERESRWPQLRAQLEQLWTLEGWGADGRYLVVLGRKRLDTPDDAEVTRRS